MDTELQAVVLKTSVACYLLLVAGYSFAVRALIILIRVWRYYVEHHGQGAREFSNFYRRALFGLGCEPFKASGEHAKDERARGDYLTAWILGLLELAAYPYLFAADKYEYVGAWIGFKVVAQYKTWSEDRGTFTVFLIGNALVLIIAFKVLRSYVGVPP